jgi:hypothetical protein
MALVSASTNIGAGLRRTYDVTSRTDYRNDAEWLEVSVVDVREWVALTESAAMAYVTAANGAIAGASLYSNPQYYNTPCNYDDDEVVWPFGFRRTVNFTVSEDQREACSYIVQRTINSTYTIKIGGKELTVPTIGATAPIEIDGNGVAVFTESFPYDLTLTRPAGNLGIIYQVANLDGIAPGGATSGLVVPSTNPLVLPISQPLVIWTAIYSTTITTDNNTANIGPGRLFFLGEEES